MTSKLEISPAANGFIVRQPTRELYAASSEKDAHVFETFGALAKWLDANLEKPKEPSAPGVVDASST